jgi:hypothetical protein
MLEYLLAKWNTLEILQKFWDLGRRALIARSAGAAVTEFEGLPDVAGGFFESNVQFGDRIRVTARLSQFCPIYYPVAYSPQTPGRINPGPTGSVVRAHTGHMLGFMYSSDVPYTPRVISSRHLDRTSEISVHASEPAIPVLLDASALSRCEEIVEITAQVVELDAHLRASLDAAEEEAVRYYYSSFYREEGFPRTAFMLDARTSAGGQVRPTGPHSPFFTTIMTEFSLPEGDPSRIDDSLQHMVVEWAKDNGWSRGPDKYGPVMLGPATYQPAYLEPGGHRVVQRSWGNLVVHVAPELRVVSIAGIADTTNPDTKWLFDAFRPFLRDVVGHLTRTEGAGRLLFSTDSSLVRGLPFTNAGGAAQ